MIKYNAFVAPGFPRREAPFLPLQASVRLTPTNRSAVCYQRASVSERASMKRAGRDGHNVEER